MGYLVYDADCAFCSSCARWIESYSVEVRPWQGIAQLAEVGLSLEMVMEAVQWLEPDGPPLAGALAIARALEVSGGWRGSAGRAIRSRPLRPVADLVYVWVARHRHLMPGATDACQPPPHP